MQHERPLQSEQFSTCYAYYNHDNSSNRYPNQFLVDNCFSHDKSILYDYNTDFAEKIEFLTKFLTIAAI